jgi:hypothetical protein
MFETSKLLRPREVAAGSRRQTVLGQEEVFAEARAPLQGPSSEFLDAEGGPQRRDRRGLRRR